MRTTVTLPDALVRRLRVLAANSSLPFRTVLEQTLLRGLGELPQQRELYRLRTTRLGGALPGAAEHKALAFASELENVEILSDFRRFSGVRLIVPGET